MTFDEAVAFALPIATELRHEMHRNPELSGKEEQTARRIQAILEAHGIAVVSGLGGMHGLMCTIEGLPGSSCWGIRADMDALPIQEVSDAPYVSQVPGVMHACGHDGHTTILLGTAKYLMQNRNFNGTAILIFQPAEEGGRGALAMVEDGMMERFDIAEIYGMHNMPGLPAGHLGFRDGPRRRGLRTRRPSPPSCPTECPAR